MEQPMPELSAGQVVRVVGQPLARTRLQAYSPCKRVIDLEVFGNKFNSAPARPPFFKKTY
jgi:hypothetical protein